RRAEIACNPHCQRRRRRRIARVMLADGKQAERGAQKEQDQHHAVVGKTLQQTAPRGQAHDSSHIDANACRQTFLRSWTQSKGESLNSSTTVDRYRLARSLSPKDR